MGKAPYRLNWYKTEYYVISAFMELSCLFTSCLSQFRLL